MVIKSFKLFERGDGVEDDDMPTYRQMELDLDGNYRLKEEPEMAMDYILGIPSGEVVIIDDINDFKAIVDRRMADYTHSFRGNILNCYAAPDKNLDEIKIWLRELKRRKTGDEKYNMVCKEFRNEMSRVTRRKQVVGYLPKLNGTDFYYIIVPDIKINKPYYNTKIEAMMDVCRNMKVKYPDSVFSFVDRLSQPGAKYYGLPENYNEPKPSPKIEIPDDPIVKFIEKELSNFTAFQYQIGYEVKDGKDWYYIIGNKDYTKGVELDNIKNLLDKARDKFRGPYIFYSNQKQPGVRILSTYPF